MKSFSYMCFVSLISSAISNGNLADQRTRAVTNTDVVSHTFCEGNLPAEVTMKKRTLKEVHTYAELKHDPHSSLPPAFTVCSTILITTCQSFYWPIWFNILDNQGGQLITAYLRQSTFESTLRILFSRESTKIIKGMIAPLFPNEWTRSCMAINTTSGLIDWVVEGAHVLTFVSEEITNKGKLPQSLTKKLILGARYYGGYWSAASNNIVSL